MEAFYKSIARYYDNIFPYNPIQKDFVLSSTGAENRNQSVLDVGCGTGNLTLELSTSFKQVAAIDTDPDMIEMARSKAMSVKGKTEFTLLSMLEIGNHFPVHSFDVILCFGNTLVHLDGAREIESFLQQARSLLNPGGKLLLQIVHYDRILKQDIKSLPLIDNQRIRFERYYSFHQETGKIEFSTILTVKETGRIIKNNIELYPVLKNEIEQILIAAGYSSTIFYGSFKGEKLTEDSIPLIIEAC